eukprot:Plantae.Rhodophyta-Hildenbrandia_rubra.ctg13669.p1 GENE.Plantae.Rhodophyta-Hildenbrandia_rubra.ctg13669~~Plantae.Rhodophyta-Hildenbrandia_rubra.ctg13669.p1  ORF type:complete len:236 (+),score=36.02 Plantae.Rhodophyta-Hildenbrandia_rubra.ctg13669:242-949(+)
MAGNNGHDGHGHSCSHEHGACDHGDGHGHGNGDLGSQAVQEWNLYQEVDTTRLQCLNEAEPDSLKRVLRPWEQRTDTSLPILSSDADQELLMCIPFTSPVKIRSICIIGAGDQENPAHVKAFINQESMDFSSAGSTNSVQEWDLVERNPQGEVEYPTKYTRFQNVSRLWLYVNQNFGADVTKIQYIGFKGTSTKYKRQAVEAKYEIRPLPGKTGNLENERDVPGIMGESSWNVKF